MRHLIAASFLWAFSFGLIKGRLAGMDATTVASARLLLATVAFLPLAFTAGSRPRRPHVFVGLGVVQFGMMYWFYLASFAYLQAWQIALLTVFTPVYVVFLADAMARRLEPRHLGAALLAVVGALFAVRLGGAGDLAWKGVLLIQGSNICFALGQFFYPRLRKSETVGDGPLMAWMYGGAFLLTAILLVPAGGPQLTGWSTSAVVTLLYLGVMPTALGFFLWNRGAVQVSDGWLAVANNLKIPLAVVVSWLVFREEAPWVRACLGLVLVVGALFLAGTSASRKKG